ncbi:uncharacterized protein LOC111903502 [Lactuca sativa]|uniref:uncharacterized protein LOC111903502 n=1 Tax=Lactuca sativa TaxID=4236 RepID=UPI0022B04A22|nr:uncharacterized protein LOC111903502 [Lactuca sativa]
MCTGQLLCDVGRDGNNHIYPIAWAVVCVENKDNWKWFLENLQEDLHLEGGFGRILMSDQHKGKIEAVKDLFPKIEHRQCARHVLSNFKKKFPGAQFEKLFWKACKASTEPLFNSAMKDIQLISPAAYVHLIGRNPKSWKKPIITMLEDIRLYVMQRMCSLRQKGSGWGHLDVCPNIRLALNELKIQQRYWQVLPSGLNTFETRNLGESYGVDLEKKTCSCRIWQMNGYGCVHSVAAISYVNRDVEVFVDPLYRACIYMNTYKYTIGCMNGSAMWPPTEYIPPLPPLKRKMPGRPTIKRKRDNTEVTGSHRVSKADKKIVKATKSQVKKRKAEGEGESSALKKRKGQGQNGKGKGEGDTRSGIGFKMGEGECESTSGVTKKNGKKVDTLKLRKKSERILKKKLAKKVAGKNGEGDTSTKPMDLD